ncbi:unnamed protein product, partial [Linum tenue]
SIIRILHLHSVIFPEIRLLVYTRQKHHKNISIQYIFTHQDINRNKNIQDMDHISMKSIFLVALLVFTAGVTNIGAEEFTGDNNDGAADLGASAFSLKNPCSRVKSCSCVLGICVCKLHGGSALTSSSRPLSAAGGDHDDDVVVGTGLNHVKCELVTACSCVFRTCFCLERRHPPSSLQSHGAEEELV